MAPTGSPSSTTSNASSAAYGPPGVALLPAPATASPAATPAPPVAPAATAASAAATAAAAAAAASGAEAVPAQGGHPAVTAADIGELATDLAEVSAAHVALTDAWFLPHHGLEVERAVTDIDENRKRMMRYRLRWTEVHCPAPMELPSTVTSMSHSRSGQYTFRVSMSVSASGGKPKPYLELWQQGSLLGRLDGSKLHGKVLAEGSTFGGFGWSVDEQRIAYIAERAPPEHSSLIPRVGEASSKVESRGDAHLYKEDWGEKMQGSHDLGIFVADFKAMKLRSVESTPGNVTPGQPTFWGMDLVYSGWACSPRKLGVIACIQRPSALYLVRGDRDFKAEHRCLTPSLRIARCPRPEPVRSGPGRGRLAFLGSAKGFETHTNCMELYVIDDLPGTMPRLVVPSQAHPRPSGFAGIYSDLALPRQCWGNQELFLNSFVGARTSVFKVLLGPSQTSASASSATPPPPPLAASKAKDEGEALKAGDDDDEDYEDAKSESAATPLDVEKDSPQHSAEEQQQQLQQLQQHPQSQSQNQTQTQTQPDIRRVALPPKADPDASVKVLAVSESHLLLVWSTPLHPERAAVQSIEDETDSIDLPLFGSCAIAAGLPRRPALPPSEGFRWKVCGVTPSDGGARFDAVLVEPTDVFTPGLVLLLHGGPHSLSTTAFAPHILFLARATECAVLSVNYRGSPGFGRESLETLPGKVGSQDVQDCMDALMTLLKTGKYDEDRVAVVGGSHGGFLTAHLIGQHPLVFAAAAMRNPVTNMASMSSATDIPDWCFVEGLGQSCYNFSGPQGLKAEDFAKLFKQSPMAHVDKVKTPTLIALGMKDRRVPPFQGLDFYHAIRARAVQARLLCYEDESHPLEGAAADMDHWVNVAAWFQQHLPPAASPPPRPTTGDLSRASSLGV